MKTNKLFKDAEPRQEPHVTMDSGPYCPACGKNIGAGSWGDQQKANEEHFNQCTLYHMRASLEAKRRRRKP